MKTFVDSSAWFSAANRKDSNNQPGIRLLRVVYRYGPGRSEAFEVLR